MRGSMFSLASYTLSIIALLIVLCTSAFAQQKKLQPLHIALANHSVTMTAIYVAQHLRIFESYGYDARVLVLEPRAALAALLSGELDFYTAIGSTARAALSGLQVRVGLVALNRPDFSLVATKKNHCLRAAQGQSHRRLHAARNCQCGSP